MSFPFEVTAQLDTSKGTALRKFVVHGGLTILLGPNGSGKTQLLRAAKLAMVPHANQKKVRFISAGRIGVLEQFRADYDGHRGGRPNYDGATYGAKGDAARRHLTETLVGDFQTLAERADILIKIQERLRKLFNRDLLVEWDGGNLKLSFARLEAGGVPYSSGREASGLMHLIGILAALYDDDVGVLLLDEPEVSLHPQLQAFLLGEIRGVVGYPAPTSNKKIVVIATHSTEMLQIGVPEDLLSLVFCYDFDSPPVQIAAGAGELQNKKIRSLVARLGQEHKLALFCKRPLLVEGPSDSIVCAALANKAEMHLEAAGAQLLPVIGKGQMPVVAKLLRLLGKEPVALADADGIADGLELVSQFVAGNADADASANRLGFPSAHDMAAAVFGDFCKLVDTRWSEISSLAESHPYWVNRNPGEEIGAKRRAAFCTLFLPGAIDGSGADWVSMRTRFESLLSLLENSGLFVLRRGSIESYYMKADRAASSGKPTAAAIEIEHIDQTDKATVTGSYADVMRCIQFAAKSKAISEAEAIRDLLLSIVAPAHARLRDGKPEALPLLARSILGERAKMFGLSIEDDALVVSIESRILDITGFPLRIAKDDDVVRVVNAALGISPQGS